MKQYWVHGCMGASVHSILTLPYHQGGREADLLLDCARDNPDGSRCGFCFEFNSFRFTASKIYLGFLLGLRRQHFGALLAFCHIDCRIPQSLRFQNGRSFPPLSRHLPLHIFNDLPNAHGRAGRTVAANVGLATISGGFGRTLW